MHTECPIILLKFLSQCVIYREKLCVLLILASKYEAFSTSKCFPWVKDAAQIQRQVMSVNKQLS